MSTKWKLKLTAKVFKLIVQLLFVKGSPEFYSLPEDVWQNCGSNLNWIVEGGTILSQSNGKVEVLWNNIDQYGFGYLTFIPSGCNIDCAQPTTVKIPVIQTKGTIQGPSYICLDEQGRFKLPQWPTTDIDWEIVGSVNNSLGEIIQTRPTK